MGNPGLLKALGGGVKGVAVDDAIQNGATAGADGSLLAHIAINRNSRDVANNEFTRAYMSLCEGPGHPQGPLNINNSPKASFPTIC